MTVVADGQILEAVLCLLDANPRPNILFSAPAVPMVLLERTIGCQPGSITLDQVLRVSDPLLGTVFAEPRRPVPRKLSRNGKTEEWVVFEASDEVGRGREQLSSTIVSNHLNRETEHSAQDVRSRPVERQDQLRLPVKNTSTRSPSPRRTKLAVVDTPSSDAARPPSSGVERVHPDTLLPLDRSISKHTPQSGHAATPGREDHKQSKPATKTVQLGLEPEGESRVHGGSARRPGQEWRRNGVVWEQNEEGSTAGEEYAQDVVSQTHPVEEKKPSFLRSLSLRSKATVAPLQPSEGGIEDRDTVPALHRATPIPSANQQSVRASPVPIEESRQQPSSLISPEVQPLDTDNNAKAPSTPKRPSRDRRRPSGLPLVPPWRINEPSLPSAPLPKLPVTLRLDPTLPGGEYEPSIKTAVGEGERPRKRGFLRDLISRKKSQAPLVPDTRDWAESSTGVADSTRRVEGAGDGDPVEDARLSHDDVAQRNMYEDAVAARSIDQSHMGDTSAQETYPVEDQDSHLPRLHHPADAHARHDERRGNRNGVEQTQRRRNHSSSSRHKAEDNPHGTARAQPDETGSTGHSGIEPRKDGSMRRASDRASSTREQRQTLEVEVDDDHGPAQDDLDEEDLQASHGDSDTDSLRSALHSASRPSSTPPSPTTPVPTTYRGKVFDGLPFGPDVPATQIADWIKDRWQLLFAELVVVVGLAYMVQASGL